MFDANQFLRDYNIDHSTRSSHSTRGWVNIECPLCRGNPGYHGGFVVDDPRFDEGYRCWRCGWHWIPKVIAALLKIDTIDAIKLAKKYGLSDKRERSRENRTKRRRKSPDSAIGFDAFLPLDRLCVRYLEQRGFDARKLESEWGLRSAPITSPYCYRVIAPIYLDGVLISYQGRDITGKSKMKYKACLREHEAYPHQHSLYGIDKAKGKTGLILEGITDVWRIGPPAVGTFGIDWTIPQAGLFASKFDSYFILYDNDPQAVEQAYALARRLNHYGLTGEIITLDDYQDPGEMTKKDVLELRRILGI